MSARYRWAWFVLVVLIAGAFFWTNRRQYTACDTDGCVVIDRWTGGVTFQPAEDVEPDVVGTEVVLRAASAPARTAREIRR
ncbi:MAG TPA: hypothetical protein VFL93_12735 [Longimicrobiaceae bacterium]|nr:hypothetical protein [Longimicrobiaceae bacterium]